MIYDCLCIRDRDQTGEGHLCFMGLGELNGNFEGWGGGGGQMQYWGTLKHKKTNFQVFGEQSYLYFRGTRERVSPSPREGFISLITAKAHIICEFKAF